MAGAAGDASFAVEAVGRAVAIVFESGGGTRGTDGAQNRDYRAGLQLVLERIGRAGMRIANVEPASTSPQAANLSAAKSIAPPSSPHTLRRRRSAMMTGRCLCGSVQFTAGEVETAHHACHCGMCRRWSGGAGFFGAHATDAVFTQKETLAVYESSKWAARGFCKACGTPLYYFLKPTKAYSMNVGTFDDPAPFRLVREIFIDRKPAGFDFAGDHERWTEEETFERLTPA